MKKLITITFICLFYRFSHGQNMEMQQQIDSLKIEVKELKEYKKTATNYGVGSLIGLAFLISGGFAWLFKSRLPFLVDEAMKKKIKEEIEDYKKRFSKIRFSIVSSVQKDADFADFLTKNGFESANLNHFSFGEYTKIDLNKTDILLINNLNSELDDDKLRTIFKHFQSQKIFYVGEQKLSSDLFELCMKPPANSQGTFISNFLKALG